MITVVNLPIPAPTFVIPIPMYGVTDDRHDRDDRSYPLIISLTLPKKYYYYFKVWDIMK